MRKVVKAAKSEPSWAGPFPVQNTYPISINNELEDIAGICGQNPHCGPWDELTVVLERKTDVQG